MNSFVKYNELSQDEINHFIEWALDKEKKSRSLLSPVLIQAYKARPLRPFIRKLALQLEGGPFFTKTLRDIFAKYYNVRIGMYSYGGVFDPSMFHPGNVIIGNYCTIASIMGVHRRNHPVERVSTHPLFYNDSCSPFKEDMLEIPWDNPLYIGHDVWIGRRSIILPKCSYIGDGAVIGAGSVVTKNVEPYTIVSGNPVRIIRRRFKKEVEKRIIQSEWWLQPLHVVAKNLPCFINNPTIDLFNRFNFYI